eukprot:756513-Hanusia_phi.AAC.2
MSYFDISVVSRPCGRALLLLVLAVSSLSSADRSFPLQTRRLVLLPRRPSGLLSLRGGRGLLACFGATEEENIAPLTVEVADAPAKGLPPVFHSPPSSLLLCPLLSLLLSYPTPLLSLSSLLSYSSPLPHFVSYSSSPSFSRILLLSSRYFLLVLLLCSLPPCASPIPCKLRSSIYAPPLPLLQASHLTQRAEGEGKPRRNARFPELIHLPMEGNPEVGEEERGGGV